jgi:hypothetical protein
MPPEQQPDWKRIFGQMRIPEAVEGLAALLAASLGTDMIVEALSRLEPWQRIAVGRELLRGLGPRERRLFRVFVAPTVEEIWTHQGSGRQIRVHLAEDGCVRWFEFMDSRRAHFGLYFLGLSPESDPALYFTGPFLTEVSGGAPDPDFDRAIASILSSEPSEGPGGGVGGKP